MASHPNGSTPRERELTRRLGGLVTDAQRILDTDLTRADGATPTLETAGDMLAAVALSALDELRSAKRGQPRVQELCDLSVRAADLEGDLRDHGIQRRTRALAGVEAALGRLRCMSTSSELVDNVCKELVRSCGFNRALLSRLEDKTWIPWVVHFGHRELRESDAEWIANRRIPLSKMTLERELIENRQAAYIVDATGDDRADQPFVDDTSATSYVASPIIPEGRVVGFLHADYYPTGRAVDRVDRDILWAFAEGFGRIYERTVLLERLNAQRDHVRQTLRNAEALMDKLAHGELELARREEERSMISGRHCAGARGRAVVARRAAHPARARGPVADRGRPEQQRDRRAPGDLRGHRQVARQADPAQDRRGEPLRGDRAVPGDGRRLRLTGCRLPQTAASSRCVTGAGSSGSPIGWSRNLLAANTASAHNP